MAPARPGEHVVLDRSGLDLCLARLAGQGYAVLGPVVRDGAIVFGELATSGDLPVGWHDTHAPGSYRLEQTGDEACFAWAVGPQSPKREFFPPSETLFRAERTGATVTFTSDRAGAPRPIALVGARPCELAGLAILDRVLVGGAHRDTGYEARRAGAFVVAAECTRPGATCFCTSMGTGPDASTPADLALIELGASDGGVGGATDDGGHRFLVRIGSPAGAALLDGVPQRAATPADLAARAGALAGARAAMGRALDLEGLPELLEANLEHPRWAEVAERCLSCGNCTLVCPTCFCSDVDDVSDLVGVLERRRHWASCFDLEHSRLHPGPVRSSTASRYRQWATHKLGTWHAQFGTSGCVGCGRCITWCPVGIDITEEAAAIRASDVRLVGHDEREAS